MCTTRVTELSNDITKEIDTGDSTGIVHLLRQSDAQLFAGYGAFNSIYDSTFLQKLDCLGNKIAEILQENVAGSNNMIVFTGCGTSGRLAWSCSCSFNRLLTRLQVSPCFHYLIAGGDKALIVGDELPEDDPPRGAQDLAELTEGADRVILVGITCGLSAPYVAGQIDYAMEKDKFYPVLIGFNQVAAARDVRIEKWDKTCKDTFSKLDRLERTANEGMIINPIVGPEPITGSSRMKGGSMTAIILNTVFLLAYSRTLSEPLVKLLRDLSSSTLEVSSPPPPQALLNGTSTRQCENGGFSSEATYCLNRGQSSAAAVLDAFNASYVAAYRPAEGLAAIMEEAGACLRDPVGHLYYIGSRLFGIVGFIDSSEMVSTFGSSPHEVRGFVEGAGPPVKIQQMTRLFSEKSLKQGWPRRISGLLDVPVRNDQHLSSLVCTKYIARKRNMQGSSCLEEVSEQAEESYKGTTGDLSSEGDLFRISVEDFERDILPSLTEHDCVLCLRDLPNERGTGDTLPDGGDPTGDKFLDRLCESPANCCMIAMTDSSSSRGNTVDAVLADPRFKIKLLIQTPYFNVAETESLFGGFALKLVLNAVSTGANILKGRVYENMMINLKVANDKLFYRSIGIISKLGRVEEKAARIALLKAIYKTEDVEKVAGDPTSQHIKTAVKQNMIVPLSLILASQGCTVSEAEAILSSKTVVRDIIQIST